MKRYLLVKRMFDIIISFMALVVLLPFCIIFAIIIKMESRGPVLFKQKRVGKNKKSFYILKFRTMKIDTPEEMPTYMLNDADSCITTFGGILRKTSLDELPQIINILKGDMSIIGPRPVLWKESELINERDKYGANDVLPGLTGLAQINGRDKIGNAEKAKIDGEYVKNISFKLDVEIFLKTIPKVLKHEGVVEGVRTYDVAEQGERVVEVKK